ncbi:MAG TPA: hypothetical protein VF594_07075 [Rubricoccaceae bacterium]|jgi:hypothetical protein
MTLTATLAAFEDALKRLGVPVRRGRGGFRGGRCTVDGRDVVVLNTLHPPEAHVAVLAGALAELPHDGLYLRPAVRAALDDALSGLSRQLPRDAAGVDAADPDAAADAP